MRNQEDGPNCVKFSNVQIKKDILKTIKKLKGITLHKYRLEGTDRNINLNEDLPDNEQRIFEKVREIENDRGSKAAYCTNGIFEKIGGKYPY